MTYTPSSTFTPTVTYTPSITPSRTYTASPTPPPNGVQGRQSVLTLLDSVQASPFWDVEMFSRETEDGETYWRFGLGASAGDGILTILPPADLLNARYGSDAPARIVRAEFTIRLVTYNPPLLVDDEVYFGALLQGGDNPSNVAGVELRLSGSDALTISQRGGTITDPMAQRAYSLGTPIRIRLERDLADETLTVYVENTPVGQPIPFSGAGEAVFPLVYVHAGGVILHITAWEITLL